MYGSHGKGTEDGGTNPADGQEVRKIGLRKVGQSLKRIIEGIDPVRELVIARQKSTPI